MWDVGVLDFSCFSCAFVLPRHERGQHPPFQLLTCRAGRLLVLKSINLINHLYAVLMSTWCNAIYIYVFVFPTSIALPKHYGVLGACMVAVVPFVLKTRLAVSCRIGACVYFPSCSAIALRSICVSWRGLRYVPRYAYSLPSPTQRKWQQYRNNQEWRWISHNGAASHDPFGFSSCSIS